MTRFAFIAAFAMAAPFAPAMAAPVDLSLWVVDGACFPTAGGYNPTLTILANAYRVADHFVREAKKQNL